MPTQTILKVNGRAANYIIAIALLLGMPFFVFFGKLSDRVGRKRLLLISVVCMFFLGIWMQGKVYTANTGDILEMLSFVGDLGAGALYFIAQSFGWGRGAIVNANANYGSVFIVVAGLLNIVSAVDAHQIAIGKKQ